MFNTQSCKFSEIENNCITAKLDKKIQKREALKVKISHLEESIKELNETKDFTNNVDERIRDLQTYLEKVNDLEFRKYKNAERDEQDELEEEVDPQYEGLYKKIDLYLEKISKFTDSKKYLLLDSLVEKYGREYNPLNVVKENPSNVYYEDF